MENEYLEKKIYGSKLLELEKMLDEKNITLISNHRVYLTSIIKLIEKHPKSVGLFRVRNRPESSHRSLLLLPERHGLGDRHG